MVTFSSYQSVYQDGISYVWKKDFQNSSKAKDWDWLLGIEGVISGDASSSSTKGNGWVDTYILRGGFSTNGYRLKLQDNDVPFVKSGAFNVKVKNNYRVILKIMVINKSNWFDTGFKRNPFSRYLLSEGTSLGLPYSQGEFVLESGDYISIDIDDDYSNVAQFRVVMGGEIVFERGAVDRIVNIDIQDVEKLVHVDDEVQGALLPDGTGDLDGDGVIDSEDFDPYDPDVRFEGDIDPDDLIEVTDDKEVIRYNDPTDRTGVLLKKEYPKDPTPIFGYIIVVGVCVLLVMRGERNG